jgi:hypothetical protein
MALSKHAACCNSAPVAPLAGMCQRHALASVSVCLRACLLKKTVSATPHVSLQVLVEGPYGAPMIDVQSAHYKCFLIISGGLGWTFLRAWKHQLVSEAARGRPVKVVHAVAVLKHWNAFHGPLFRGWPDMRTTNEAWLCCSARCGLNLLDRVPV